MILRYIIGLIVGLAALVWSADFFVDNAAKFARRCGLSQLLVGMLVVGFGTSLPELSVSFLSAWRGNPSIALGNAYGSNIANILLILGLTAAVCPIAVADMVRRRDLPVLCVATLVSWLLLLNRAITRIDAIAMLAVFFAICIWNTLKDKVPATKGKAAEDAPHAAGDTPAKSLAALCALTVAGGVLVVGSSMLLVSSATGLARALGVSDLIIGLTVVAIGTSLPELASSLAAISKREHDIAIGNIIGSNLFNMLAVVGVAGVTRPIVGAENTEVMRTVLLRDYPVMAGVTLLLFLFCVRWGRGRATIGRAKGIVFLVLYVGYIAMLAKETLA